MINWEAVLKANREDELRDVKIFLFRENARLENERREMMELREKFLKERVQFRDEMNRLNHKMVVERKRLKDENLFFDKKFQILQDGFKQLEADRRKFDKDRTRFEKEKELLMHEFSGDFHADNEEIAAVLFRGTSNFLTVRKRYKDLMKIFHPDNLCGDAELVQLINKEYEKRRRERF